SRTREWTRIEPSSRRADPASRRPFSRSRCIRSAVLTPRCTTARGRNGQDATTPPWKRERAMPAEPYTLSEFIADLDRITREEEAGRAITECVAPLLGRLVKNPESIPAEYRRRAADGGRGRYMLHRAPRFNVTSVVWRPGDTAGCDNHETWGVIGVISHDNVETRYRVTEQPGGRAAIEVKSVT